MISHAITPYFKEREAKPVTFTHISFTGTVFNIMSLKATDEDWKKIRNKIERSNWLKNGGK